jgi:glucokinase
MPDQRQFYLALDVGGTKTQAALFTDDGVLADDYVHSVPSQTHKGQEAVYENTKAALVHIVEHFALEKSQLLGIGVGSPGPLDRKKGLIVHAPLMGWRNFPLVDRLHADFQLPVAIDNDGNLGALAEQRCGVAKGARNCIYITVSTGCGGGIIINGEVYRGAHDGAGEIGHMSIDPEGLPCPCGSRGCFELYASGTAMLRTMRVDRESGRPSKVFELAGGDVEKLSGRLLDEAAAAGDEYARAVYQKEGYYLGVGLANLFNLFDPECIVLGGGITKGRQFFHAALMSTLRERAEPAISDDSVRYSLMNDRVVLYGAYYLIANTGDF